MLCGCCVDEERPEQITIAIVPESLKDEKRATEEQALEQEERERAKKAEVAVKELPPQPAVPEPAPASTEFVVSIEKDGKLGLSLETLLEKFCVVRGVDPGSKLKDVQSYDRLLTVNGNSVKAAGLAKMIADNRHLELRFQRPVLKEIKLEKKGKTVGFKVDTSLNTYGLVIEDLTEGAALDLPAGTFKPMDRVIAVDGKEAPPSQLLEMIKASDAPTLRLCSYSD